MVRMVRFHAMTMGYVIDPILPRLVGGDGE